jgi:hypothetical protein
VLSCRIAAVRTDPNTDRKEGKENTKRWDDCYAFLVLLKKHHPQIPTNSRRDECSVYMDFSNKSTALELRRRRKLFSNQDATWHERTLSYHHTSGKMPSSPGFSSGIVDKRGMRSRKKPQIVILSGVSNDMKYCEIKRYCHKSKKHCKERRTGKGEHFELHMPPHSSNPQNSKRRANICGLEWPHHHTSFPCEASCSRTHSSELCTASWLSFTSLSRRWRRCGEGGGDGCTALN